MDDLVSLAFDDAVLDRLAARTNRSGQRRAADAPGDRVSHLFAQWQDRLAARPEPAALDADVAADLVCSAPRRSALRPALAIAAVICALLVGSAAIGARTAQPGDPLFPVTQVLWTDQADSAVAGQQVRQIIGIATGEVAAGRLAHAAELLRRADRELIRITSSQAHAEAQNDLLTAWGLLSRASSAAGQQLAAGGFLITAIPGSRAAVPPLAGVSIAGLPGVSTAASASLTASLSASLSGAGGSGATIASRGTTAIGTAAAAGTGGSTGHAAVSDAPPGTPTQATPGTPAAAQQPPPAVTSTPTTASTASTATSAPLSTTATTAAPPTGQPGTATTAPGSPPATGTQDTQAPITPSPTASPTGQSDPTAPSAPASSASNPPAMTGQAMMLPPSPSPTPAQTGATTTASTDSTPTTSSPSVPAG